MTRNSSDNSLTLKTKASWIIALLVIIHIIIIGYFVGNFFWYDDLIVTFYEVERFLNASNPIEAWQILSGPYGDHRSMTSRVFFLFQILLNNYEVRYDYLMLMGNVFIFPIVYFFKDFILNSVSSFFYLIPIVAFFLNAQFFEAQFFANGVFCYLVVIFFSIWLIYETSNKERLGLMMVIALLGIFTFVSSFFAIFSAAAILFLKKKWQKLGGWLIFSVIISIFYFKSQENDHQTEIDLILHLSKNTFKNTFYHLGSIFNFEHFLEGLPVLFLGMFLFLFSSIYLIYKTYLNFRSNKGYNSNEFFLLGLIIFGLLSAFSIGALRGLESPANLYFSRYKFGPMIVLCCCYMILIREVKVKPILVYLILLLFYLPSQAYYLFKIKDFHEAMQTHVVNYKLNPQRINSKFNPSNLSSKVNVTYSPENYLLSYFMKEKGYINTDNKIESSINYQDEYTILKLAPKDPKANLNKNEGNFLYIFSPKDTVLFSFNSNVNKAETIELKTTNKLISRNLNHLYYLNIKNNIAYWAKIENQKSYGIR